MIEVVAEYLALTYANVQATHSVSQIGKKHYNSSEDTVISHAIEYIRQNYNTKVGVSEIADFCHCSESYISHIFKRRTGVNINTYINKTRVEFSKHYLITTNDSMSDISINIGFNDPNYFSRVFTELIGCPPSEFRRRFRNADMLAIDDIHFLANKPSTQEEFLHTFNTIDMAGKQIILASDAHPKMIGQISDSLVNRFVSGMVVKIESPDFTTRCAIVRQRAASMAKSIPDNVIEYIAQNLKTNVRELEGALLKLIAFASLSNEKISLGMARQVLEEHISRTDPIVHISDIESSVSTFFGLTPADIHSSKKDRTVTLARSFSMYLARKHTKMSFPEIGKFMGGKNHATVLLACRKVDEYLKTNSDINWTGTNGNRVSKAKPILAQLEEAISK
jgi:AraC-like DNA-binding protein